MHTENTPTPWQFTSAEEALFWSADVLRSRRTPQLTMLWKYVLEDAPDAPPRPHQPSTLRLYLPDTPEDRTSLAHAVEKILSAMGEEGTLLRLHGWGDWSSDAQLRGAMKLQEQARQNDQNILLNYRMSFRQLAQLYRCDHKTIAARIRRAFQTLSLRLQSEGLLFIPNGD